ncbi:MAG: glycoside hydrolase family 2 TIM barrel-domain containing protein [Ilumatobacter sp.]|uniref:glycoside hydrolase family 2 TIM barrel-domain containing protein n=3 Tax=Ilumatobacter sp. TaxID=1967498 RepID=UPI003298ADCE
MLPVIGAIRPWADPAVTSMGRLAMAPPTAAHDSIAGARSADPLDTADAPWRTTLNGKWHFALFDHPDHVPPEAVTGPVGEPATGPTGSVPAASWTKVTVPGNWTMQGVVDQHGRPDLPQYTNVQMPFDGPPPNLPASNPTGVYRRSFSVSTKWNGRRVIVHIGGAESVHAVYLNGQFAGYGTDSRLASEFDVTEYVRSGRNDIAVVVVKWSAHSYVEDQDQWWMGGLHRDCYVEGRAATRVTSVACDATYNHISGAGRLTVHTTVGGAVHPRRGWSIRTSVETTAGTDVTASRRTAGKPTTSRKTAKNFVEPVTSPVPYRFVAPMRFTGFEVTAVFDVADVDAWSAERPSRYRVFVELLDPDGTVTEVHTQLVGFRTIEIRERQFFVNGQPIWFFGVNRHDHHPERGKAVTVDDMREDLLAMRRHNITAVRTSHYPNDPRLLDLCDEIGMYVVDEANIEAHAYNTSLCDDPSYRSAWVDRVSRMVERDRNHPSVVMWSLGNEAGHGTNHTAAAGFVRRTDPSRPLHYEPASFHEGWIDGGRESSDVVCPMYPTIDAIVAYGDDPSGDRPLIMCEYSHAMGNSNGSLADYWDAILTIPGLQGGFIWEWKDHGLTTKLPNGKKGFAYGGQFGEPIHDGNFVADGIMAADLTPHPAISEVEWCYRPVAVEAVGRSKLKITNRQSFTGLGGLDARWQLTVSGVVTGSGALDVDVAPHGSATIGLPCPLPTEADSHLSVRWTLRNATAWAPAGHLVAWDQVELRAPKKSRRHLPVAASSSGEIDVATITPILSLFRAPTDNDGFKLMPDMTEQHGIGGHAYRHWLDSGLDTLDPSDPTALEALGVEHDHTTEVHADGSVLHRHRVVVPDGLADLGRIGTQFELPGAFDRMRWHGRGPAENYPDRRRGSMIEIWEAGIADQPYLVPQEFGLRTDCRWLELMRSDTGETMRIDVIAPVALHVSATHFTDDDLHRAAHQTDLRPGTRLVVKIDVAHRGIGTASCGPDVLPRYEIPTGRHDWSYLLSRR